MSLFEDSLQDDPSDQEALGPIAHPTTQAASVEVMQEKKTAKAKKQTKQTKPSDVDQLAEETQEENMIAQEEEAEESRLNNLPHQLFLELIEQMILSFNRFHEISAKLSSNKDKNSFYGPLAEDFSKSLDRLTMIRSSEEEKGNPKDVQSEKTETQG